MSYSLYLWHWPGIVFGRTLAEYRGFPRKEGELLGAAIGILAAVVAYNLVEQPMRRRGPGRAWRLKSLGLGFSVAAAASIALAFRPVRVDSLKLFDRPEFHVTLYSTTSDGITGSFRGGTRYADVVEPPSEPRSADSWRTGGIVHPWGGGVPRVVVLGSSHALMYGRVIDDVCRQQKLSVSFLCSDGISSFFGNNDQDRFSREFDEARLRYIEAWKPELVLVVERLDGPSHDLYRRNYEHLVDVVQPHSERILFVGQAPALSLGESVNLREFVAWNWARTGVLPRIRPAEGEADRRRTLRFLADLVRRRPNTELLTLDDLFAFPDGSVRYAEGRKFFYADDDHLSQAGAELVQDRIADAIARNCKVPAPDGRHSETRVARLTLH